MDNVVELRHVLRLSDAIPICEAERQGLGPDFVIQDINNQDKPICPDCYRILTSDVPLF